MFVVLLILLGELDRANREAQERANREAQERANREAQERANREAQERADREAQERADREARTIIENYLLILRERLTGEDLNITRDIFELELQLNIFQLALTSLQQGGILTQPNFERVTAFIHPYSRQVEFAINLLKEAEILTQENLDFVINHSQPDIFASVLIDLHYAAILSSENINFVSYHPDFSDLAFLLSVLRRSNILTQENLNHLKIHNNLPCLALEISSLERRHNLKQASFDDALIRADLPSPVLSLSNQSTGCLLFNLTPYDITYITIKNIKRDLGVITALILSEQFIPVIGQIATAVEAPFIIKEIMSLGNILELLILIVTNAYASLHMRSEIEGQLIDCADIIKKSKQALEGIEKISSILGNIKIGTIKPGESEEWFEGGIQSCEALVQIASFTDSAGLTKIMGVSLIAEPEKKDYNSQMDYIYLDSNIAAHWNTPDLSLIETMHEWLIKINDIMQKIKSISEELKSCASNSEYKKMFIYFVKSLFIQQNPQELAEIIVKQEFEQYESRLSIMKQELAPSLTELKIFCSTKNINCQIERFNQEEHDLYKKYQSNIKFKENISLDILISDNTELLSRLSNLTLVYSQNRSDTESNLTALPDLGVDWPGLRIAIVCPNPITSLPIKGQAGYVSGRPYIKATGPEAIPKKGATMFLNGAANRAADGVTFSYLKERIHIHLPSRFNPTGNNLFPTQGYSYWISGIQENNLSDMGWCVNFEFQLWETSPKKKYKLSNTRDIGAVVDDTSYAIITDGIKKLVQLGRLQQTHHLLFNQVTLENTRDEIEEQESSFRP